MLKTVGAILLLSTQIFGQDLFLTMETSNLAAIGQNIDGVEILGDHQNVSLVKVQAKDIEKISHVMHEEFKKCGGFFAYESLQEAKDALASLDLPQPFMPLVDYNIDQQDLVTPMITTVDDIEITATIEKLSSFHNRYYRSRTGVESQNWIKEKWESLTKHRSDVSVDFYNHDRWPQPSLIMTVKGSENPDEVIIVGGHADSIAGFWDRANARAPGADDNASGIATFTEVIRVLMNHNFVPKRTLKFMAYAAEEVGLLGSNEIARDHKNKGINVVGVLQLDMTNRNGSDLDIVMMRDYTNADQNEFLGMLIDEYVKVPWGYSQCGYGCSDHASWHRQGYPASIPFESTMGDINRKIHTAYDTLEVSGGHSRHAEKFAKLALAYVVELAQK